MGHYGSLWVTMGHFKTGLIRVHSSFSPSMNRDSFVSLIKSCGYRISVEESNASHSRS